MECGWTENKDTSYYNICSEKDIHFSRNQLLKISMFIILN